MQNEIIHLGDGLFINMNNVAAMVMEGEMQPGNNRPRVKLTFTDGYEMTVDGKRAEDLVDFLKKRNG